MSLFLKLADKVFDVHIIHHEVEEFLREYITDEAENSIKIEIKEEDIEFERNKSKTEDIKNGIAIRDFSPRYLETLALYRKLAECLIEYDIILFHGSLISVDDKGYLFTAKSGTGKSTHTRLWRELLGERAVMINDDKPLLKICDNSVIAYGTPWDGKHRLSTNRSVKLNAICILNRGTENSIKMIKKSEMPNYFSQIFTQIYRSKDPIKLKKTLELTDKLLKNTDIYNLFCNMDISAAELSYNAMKGQQNEN